MAKNPVDFGQLNPEIYALPDESEGCLAGPIVLVVVPMWSIWAKGTDFIFSDPANHTQENQYPCKTNTETTFNTRRT